MGSIERRSQQDRRRLDIGSGDEGAVRRVLSEGRMTRETDQDYPSWQDHRRTVHVMVIQERPTNIPGRLWGDF